MEDLNIFLKKIFPTTNFKNEDKLIERGLIDSLDLFRLVTALEDEYKISIPDEEISFNNFNSITAIHSLISKLSSINKKKI